MTTEREHISLAEAVGRTIEAVGEADSCTAMALSGGAYVFLYARNGWGDDGIGKILEDEPRLTWHSYGTDEAAAMIAAGLWTTEEVNDTEREYRAGESARREEQDRRVYERLRAKFEPADTQEADHA